MGTCPKCGFVQPKDRYCANCGVDTESYRPPPPSFGMQILQSPWSYVILGLVAIYIVVKTVDPQRVQRLSDRVFSWKGSTRASLPNQDDGASDERSIPESPQQDSLPGTSSAAGAAAELTPGTPSIDATASKANKSQSFIQKATISYFVAPLSLRSQLLGEGGILTLLDKGLYAGIFTEVNDLLDGDSIEWIDRADFSSDGYLRWTSSSGFSTAPLGVPTSSDSGVDSNNVDTHNYSYEIHLFGVKSEKRSVQIKIKRNHLNGNSDSIDKQLLGAGNHLLFVGLHRPEVSFAEESSEESSNNPLLKIFERPDIKAGKAEVWTLVQWSESTPETTEGQ